MNLTHPFLDADGDKLREECGIFGVIGAKEAVYRLIRELAESGKSILLYSTETEELAALCDRVLVMDRGRLVATLAGPEITAESLMRAGLGLVGSTLAAPVIADAEVPCPS